MSDLIIVIIIIAVISGLTAAVIFGFYLFEKNIGCPRFAQAIERPYRYDFAAGGCFVQTDKGQWVAQKNYWNNVTIGVDK